ncbi:MAG TPA: SDR family oxidoreductase [Actinomycetota bacterium]|nr:SDR family oxidoreductase [Actinomycetota bacterium]
MRPEGKVVLVTGGANGIGLATCIEFARRGCAVSIVDIDEEAMASAATQVREAGGRDLSLVKDVTTEAGVREMISETIERFGDLDILINNAGVSITGPAESTPVEDWRWALDINVWPHIYAVREALPYFRQRGSGHLVHVASAAGLLGTPSAPAYCLTKFAVVGLAESLATSLYGSGIGVTVVCPQFVDTDIAFRGRVSLGENAAFKEDEVKNLSRQMMKTVGISASVVAESIVDAVENDKFLALPHPEILEFARKKWADPERFLKRTSEVLREQGLIFG